MRPELRILTFMDALQKEEMLKKIGMRVKELRVKAGYKSHEQFAFDNNIQPKQMWRWESGYDFKVSSLIRIAKIHKITLEEFLKDIE